MDIARRGNADIKEQLQLLEDMVHITQANIIVELGTRKGVSTAALLAGIWKRTNEGYGPSTLYTVDLFNLPLHWWHEEYEVYVQRVLGDTRTVEIPPEIEENGIDLLFIDSSHLADQTTIELDRWGTLVRPGGIILLHDNLVCEPGVDAPARAFVEKHSLQYLIDDRQCGMGIILVNKSLRKPVLEEAVA